MIYFTKVFVSTLIYDLICVFEKKDSVLKRKGLLSYQNFLDKKTVLHLKKTILDYLDYQNNQNKNSNIDVRGRGGVDEGMLDISRIDMIVNDLFKLIKINDIKKILSDNKIYNLKLSNINCYINKNVKNTRGAHSDSHTKKQIKAFIYLTDVLNENDGPYCYALGSNKFNFSRYKNMILNYFFKKPLTNFNLQGTKYILSKIFGKQGDLIISDQNGIHRGWPQDENGFRMLISINFTKG